MDGAWETRRQFAWTAPEVPLTAFNYSAPVYGRAAGRTEPFGFVVEPCEEVGVSRHRK